MKEIGCTEEDIINFDKLKYKHKVIFVSKEMNNIKSAYYIPETENKNKNDIENRIINLTEYEGRFKAKRFYEEFDFVNFFNNRE